MLFDGTGQAIYRDDVEAHVLRRMRRGMATRAQQGVRAAGQGVESSLLAITDRADGTVRLLTTTIPLYFHGHEGKRYVKCHEIFLDGGKWYVVRPSGGPAPPRSPGAGAPALFRLLWRAAELAWIRADA